jgi:hypothetical protein
VEQPGKDWVPNTASLSQISATVYFSRFPPLKSHVNTHQKVNTCDFQVPLDVVPILPFW